MRSICMPSIGWKQKKSSSTLSTVGSRRWDSDRESLSVKSTQPVEWYKQESSAVASNMLPWCDAWGIWILSLLSYAHPLVTIWHISLKLLEVTWPWTFWPLTTKWHHELCISRVEYCKTKILKFKRSLITVVRSGKRGFV